MKASEIVKVLLRVAPGLATKEVVEQSKSLAFTKGSVFSFNDEVAIRAKLDLGIEGAVRGEELVQLLSRMGDVEVNISVKEDGENAELIVERKGAQAGMRLQKEILLPLSHVTVPDKWEDIPDGFESALKLCRGTVSDDLTRPALTYVHVNGNRLESCDNYRATRHKLPGKLNLDPFLISGAVIPTLLGYKLQQVGLTKEWVHFRCAGPCVFSCRQLAEPYPDLSVLFKDEEQRKITFPEHMQAALDRAGIFTKTDTSTDEFVTVALREGEMQVSGRGEVGWYKEVVPVAYSGKAFKFSIHPDFMRDILNRGAEVLVGKTRMVLTAQWFQFVAILVAD